MKKTIIISALILVACGPKELTKEEKQKVYLDNGEKYFNSVIKNSDRKRDKEIQEIEFLLIDSIQDFSEFKKLEIKYNMLANEYLQKKEDFEQYAALDSYDGKYDDFSIKLKNQLDELSNQLDELERQQKKTSKKKIGEIVFFKMKVTNLDGSTEQNISMPIAFNLDQTVDATIMKQILN